jgi:hypothetical protein
MMFPDRLLEGVTIGRENRPSGGHYCARIYSRNGGNVFAERFGTINDTHPRLATQELIVCSLVAEDALLLQIVRKNRQLQ